MEYNDGSQFRVVTDPARYMRERSAYEFRVCSAKNGNNLYVDTAFAKHRRDLQGLSLLVMYAFPYQNAGSPESQANYFADVLGKLGPNEVAMLDCEDASGLKNPTDFSLRWSVQVTKRLGGLEIQYAPKSLSGSINHRTMGNRLLKAPRYSGGSGKGAAPTWDYDIWQYSDQGYFPGCSQSGDINFTNLSVNDILARCKTGSSVTVSSFPSKNQQKLLLL